MRAGLPKLMDANDAGGRNSEHCTLILTEGDSAKSLVVGGLSVAGRDRFGVFPLRSAWPRSLFLACRACHPACPRLCDLAVELALARFHGADTGTWHH